MRGTLRALVDWVSCTFTSFNSPDEVASVFGFKLDEFSECPAGFYGYKCQLRRGNIAILWDGQPGMGVHVQLSGQGCREYEEMSVKNWAELFRDVFAAGGNFTRVDGAIDDITFGSEKLYFRIKDLVKKVKRGECRSRFKLGRSIETLHIEDGCSRGVTLYLGQGSSDVQVRFYDKAYERIAAGKQLEEGLSGWNRVEIETRRQKANDLAAYIAQGKDVGWYLSGVIRYYVQFVDKKKDQNKARWPESRWWVEFMQGVEKLRLSTKAPDRTVERAINWVNRSVSPTLAMIYAATGGDDEFIFRMIADGAERMTKEQERLAAEYLERKQMEREQLKRYRRLMLMMDLVGRKKPFADVGEDEGLDL